MILQVASNLVFYDFMIAVSSYNTHNPSSWAFQFCHLPHLVVLIW